MKPKYKRKKPKIALGPKKAEKQPSEFKILIDYVDGESLEQYYFEPHFKLKDVKYYAEEYSQEGMVELVTVYQDGSNIQSFIGYDRRSEV